MKIKYNQLVSMLTVILLSVVLCEATASPSSVDYRQEMRYFVEKISAYAKSIHPNFIIITQNGANLVSRMADEVGLVDMNYIKTIDGIGQEDLFYGYHKDNQVTPATDNLYLNGFLEIAKNQGKKIMVTDYCSTRTKIDDSYAKNQAKGYIAFVANRRELNNIPTYPNPIYNENSDNIIQLQDAQNFLYLISPDDKYPSPQIFIEAVRKTNYDLIIIDAFFNKTLFNQAQIQRLKQKANGAKRLVIAYMSIGEAENYRYYWQSHWRVGQPSFIVKENPQWRGNYTVKYWQKTWQNMIFGNHSSYLKKILDTGFDGVYLDKIDAFEQFE